MSLESIRRVQGRGVCVPGNDLDTDQIIPARFLMCVTFDALGGQLFYDARFRPDGTEKPHPLNDPRYQGASILVSGENFGCGSSREHAPQSIHKAGFRAIIAASFAEIFFGNSTTLGIPCVSLKEADLADLQATLQSDPEAQITVDLDAAEVRVASGGGERVYGAELRPSARDALIRGEWDPISQLLEGAPAVEAVKARLPYLSW